MKDTVCIPKLSLVSASLNPRASHLIHHFEKGEGLACFEWVTHEEALFLLRVFRRLWAPECWPALVTALWRRHNNLQILHREQFADSCRQLEEYW